MVKKCAQCGINIENNNYLCSNCHKLYMIRICSHSYLNTEEENKLIDPAEYIYMHGIEDNGLLWYIKFRDKLLQKVEIIRQNQENKKLKQNNKLKKEIEKW